MNQKVLKLKLFQETACYKKPFSFKAGETFPLPSYSTVKGMIHSVLKADEFIPMTLSIQGNYDCSFQNYQSMYFYKKKDEITNMPMYVNLLYNIQLVIHVLADEDILERIEEGLLNLSEHLSLGRKEDLLRVDSVQYVNVFDSTEEKSKQVTNAIYVPLKYMEDEDVGIQFSLPWKYEIVNEIRRFENIDARYLCKDDWMYWLESVPVDEENDKVFFF